MNSSADWRAKPGAIRIQAGADCAAAGNSTRFGHRRFQLPQITVGGRSPPVRMSGRRGRRQLLTVIAFSTEIAPGADQAVDPASRLAFHVVTLPVSLIFPPCAFT